MTSRVLSERMSRRRLLAGAVGLAGLGLLSACSQAPAAPSGGSGEQKPAAQSGASQPAASKQGATQQAPAKTGQPYAGTSLKMMMTNHVYGEGLQSKLPELEQKTGIKAEIDLLAFPILNQRADLELSSGSGAYDVLQMIFVRSGRWINAKWAEPLNPFIDNDKLTDKQTLDVNDFVAGAVAPFKKGDTIYALPWLADSTVVGYRSDVWAKNGPKFPETFDALQESVPKVQTAEMAGFVTQDNLHWIWPNWLISYGGGFFANPPDDLRPTFDSPEAIKTADMFATLLSKYSPPGSPKLDSGLAATMMQQGKASCFLDGMGNVQAIIDTSKGQLAEKMAFTNTPSGPKGHFPQLAVHGFLINPASKKKDAAWAMVQWATSKEMMLWAALEKGHLAGTRSSMLTNPDVKKKFTWQGSDLAALHESVMKRAGDGYMAYRTVPQFPPIGDRVIIAIQSIASGQAKAADAMKALQKDAEGLLEKEGVKVR
ncbi:MAG: extracellular solute-binding protein [Chloroflexi bacterium]|nr:extracellular solute-binding protein [Chloroflexota bacterium]